MNSSTVVGFMPLILIHYDFSLATYQPSYAFCKSARMIFRILNIACITRPAFSESLSPSISPNIEGTICHDKPYLSFNQAHILSSPPSAVNFVHNSSTSSCVLQSTRNEIDSLNLNCGPALSP